MIKLAVAIADKNAPKDAFVVLRGFEESMKKAKEMGYDGVELALCKASDIDPDRLAKLLSLYGIEISCISTGQVFAVLNQYLTNPDKEQRMQAVNTLCDIVRVAKDFGCFVNIGRARGFYDAEQTREAAKSLAIDSILRISEVAEQCNVDIIIEPVNRYEINFINNLDECAEFIGQIGSKHIGMMPDLFHMNIEDARIGEALIRHKKLIKYIHFADSNRQAPGWGHIDFDEVFDALSQIKYNGWISVEILPIPDPDSAASQACKYLRPYIA